MKVILSITGESTANYPLAEFAQLLQELSANILESEKQFGLALLFGEIGDELCRTYTAGDNDSIIRLVVKRTK